MYPSGSAGAQPGAGGGRREVGGWLAGSKRAASAAGGRAPGGWAAARAEKAPVEAEHAAVQQNASGSSEEEEVDAAIRQRGKPIHLPKLAEVRVVYALVTTLVYIGVVLDSMARDLWRQASLHRELCLSQEEYSRASRTNCFMVYVMNEACAVKGKNRPLVQADPDSFAQS